MDVVTNIMLGILAGTTIAVYECWVLSYLWLWFVSTPFGITVLSIPHIYGLVLMKSVIMFRPNGTGAASAVSTLVQITCVTTFALVLGWVVSTVFM